MRLTIDMHFLATPVDCPVSWSQLRMKARKGRKRDQTSLNNVIYNPMFDAHTSKQ